jgi:hypothetical protein
LTAFGDLPGAASGSGVTPIRIDDDGWVIGDGAFVAGSLTTTHAFEWSNGVFHDLHDSSVLHGKASHATSANRFHHICGYGNFSATAGSPAHAVLWQGSAIIDLGTLMGGESAAFAINDLGEIVGRSFVPGSPFTPSPSAVVWRNGVPLQLNSLLPAGTGWTLEEANGIDERGRIVGRGWRNGVMRPFVLTPVCAGHFSSFGAGCAPGGGAVPGLFAIGCPTPGSTFALTIDHGAPQKHGVLLVGLGSSPLAFSASCSLTIAPLAPVVVPITLDTQGELFLTLPLPAGLPIVDVNLQAILPGSNGLLGSTNALALHIE